MLIKHVSSDYNWFFNVENGLFARWGKTKEEDPDFAPIGPEILDIEVSTVCSKACSHCYKSNTSRGVNMPFEHFRTILSKMSRNLTQVAFGVGDIDANKDLVKMLSYCREVNIVPNITINGDGLTYNNINMLSKYCGAVAISNYNKDICYNAVKILSEAGVGQVNIHQLLSKETLDNCYELIYDSSNDYRLKNLRSIVFLTLKPKGRRNNYHSVSSEDYRSLLNKVIDSGINFGFDSCAANNFLKATNNKYETFVEPCESCLFSSYVNVNGEFFPCSFAEGEGFDGIKVSEKSDFVEDVWFSDSAKSFRTKLLNNNRSCPIFDLSF